jgi:hypothetical protein
MRHTLAALLVAVTIVAAGERVTTGEVFQLEIGPAIAGDSARVKKAALVVRSSCCDVATVTISGTAEGIVNGRRESVPLRLVALETPGVYAIPRVWEQGRWVLKLSGHCAERKTVAAAIVPLGSDGVVRDRVQYLTRAATPADIDAALRGVNTGSE